MAKALHHRSARYELQEYQPLTISWKPVAHAHTATEAIRDLNRAVVKKETPVYRILDRIRGVHYTKVVLEVGTSEFTNYK